MIVCMVTTMCYVKLSIMLHCMVVMPSIITPHHMLWCNIYNHSMTWLACSQVIMSCIVLYCYELRWKVLKLFDTFR